MEVLLSSRVSEYRSEGEVRVLLKKKMDSDENVVRKELVRVWTRILNKYGSPGAYIPSVEEVRRELLNVGVDAAVNAVVDEHWFVFSWMIRDDIEKKVARGLEKFDLAVLIADVRQAQNDPALLAQLKEEVRYYVLSDDF